MPDLPDHFPARRDFTTEATDRNLSDNLECHTSLFAAPTPASGVLASFSFRDQLYTVARITRQHPHWQRTTRYVQEQFLKSYGARPHINAPAFLVMTDASGNTSAAVGLRSASREPLFLENYLDRSIDQSVASSREQIIEIAHLACSDRGKSRFLFIALTALLSHWQYQWIAFTGTRAVRHIFSSLNMKPVTLAPANPALLEDGGRSWGRYYEQEPQVMAGRISGGHDTLMENGVYRMLNLQLHGDLQNAVA